MPGARASGFEGFEDFGLKGRFSQPRAKPWESRREPKAALKGTFAVAMKVNVPFRADGS
jgi:hypothetical protein